MLTAGELRFSLRLDFFFQNYLLSLLVIISRLCKQKLYKEKVIYFYLLCTTVNRCNPLTFLANDELKFILNRVLKRLLII